MSFGLDALSLLDFWMEPEEEALLVDWLLGGAFEGR